MKYIGDFLYQIGGLSRSLMAAASFLVLGYQNFVAQKSLLKRLYGEQIENDDDDIYSQIKTEEAD